jgi:hypothetical protein
VRLRVLMARLITNPPNAMAAFYNAYSTQTDTITALPHLLITKILLDRQSIDRSSI